MTPSALPVRTHVAAFDKEATFHDLMAERLRQAPWLALSAALHAVVLLTVWLLLPPEVRRVVENCVAVATEEVQDVLPPEPPPPVETKAEPIEDSSIVDPTDVEPTPSDVVSDEVMPSLADPERGDPTTGVVGIGPGKQGLYKGRVRGGPGGGGGGGSPRPSQLEDALQWLARHQDDDGKWDCDDFMKHDDRTATVCDGAGSSVHDVGVTGLALLAFLGDGNTLRTGTYRENLRRGVAWLRSQQSPDTGLFGQAASHDFLYDHAIATYAMVEAAGLSGYTLLRPVAQKALDYLAAHRNPYGVWRYQPRDNDNDTSVTGWCVMALESGRHFGFLVDDNALRCSLAWLDQISDASGVHGYTKAGEPSSRKPGEHATRFPTEKGAAMTAVGLFCRFFLGQDPREKPVMAAAAKVLLQKPPVWDTKAGTIDHYYWYYATYTLFQMGGPAWTSWQKKIEPVLVQHQHHDRAQKNLHGSWDPIGAWGEDGGRVYSTALLAMTLQAGYRYTRLVR